VKAKQYFDETLKMQPLHSATLLELGLIANRSGNLAAVKNIHTALKAIDTSLDDEFNAALNPETK
jgi:hypothetical protein